MVTFNGVKDIFANIFDKSDRRGSSGIFGPSTSRRGGSGSFASTRRGSKGTFDRKPALASRPDNKDWKGYVSQGVPQRSNIDAMIEEYLRGADGDSTDMTASINGMYNPQIDNVNNSYAIADADLERRYNEGQAKLAAMYGASQQGILGREGQVAGNFDQGISQINQQSDAAGEAIGKTYDDSAARSAAIMQMLGVQEAAPDALAGNTEDRAMNMSAVDRDQAAMVNGMEKSKVGAVNYNTQAANIVGLEGSNRGSDLLSDFISQQNEQQAAKMAALAAITGQRDSALLSSQQSSDDTSMERMKDAIGWAREDDENAATNYGQGFPEPAAAPKGPPDSPYATTYATAMQQLGPQGADKAMSVIQQLGAGDPAMTQTQFMNQAVTIARQMGIPPNVMANIASQWYSQAEMPAVWQPRADQSIAPRG